MSGYLDFNKTGCAPIDKIAEALDNAGNAYHHTEQWHDADVSGKSCVDSIQEALDGAASAVVNLERENAELRKKLEEAKDALTLVLPMAKGYAYEHQVGSNLAYADSAEMTLCHLRQS